jgi:hypothetical protein
VELGGVGTLVVARAGDESILHGEPKGNAGDHKGQCHSNKERGRQKGDFLVEIRKISFSTERHLSDDI